MRRLLLQAGWPLFVAQCSFCLALAGVASGCGSPEKLTIDELPVDFSRSGTMALDARWWQAFNEPRLDAAIDRALENNFTLLAAWQRLRAARAVVDRSSADRLPMLAGVAGVRNERQTGQSSPIRPFIGAEASWEVDLWGRINQQVTAEQRRADATAADAHAASISLSAEIALTWARLGATEERLELLEQQRENNENIIRALRQRFRAGTVRAVDILRQQALLESTLQERERALADREVARHQLAVLLGQPPQYEVDAPTALLQTPPLPATGVPSELIQRRPDVHAEFLRLEAADSDLAAASRARLPRLNLSASIISGGSAGQIFEDWATSFAAELFAPIFQGGRLNAEVERSSAVRQELFYAYQQEILDALQEVEDALVLEFRQTEQVRRIESRISLTEDALEQLLIGYQNGVTNFLDVLVALNDLQTLRRSLVDARLDRVEQRIALYRALAGPIEDVPRPDAEEQERADDPLPGDERGARDESTAPPLASSHLPNL